MKDELAPSVDPWSNPQARVYMTLGLASAIAVGLALMQYSDEVWVVAPTLVALAGLLLRWLSAPVFMLLGVALTLLVTQQRFAVEQHPINDALLAGSVVLVMLAHFRLYSISEAIFPHDPRGILKPRRPRSPGLSKWVELLMVVTIVPYLYYGFRKQRKSGRQTVKNLRRTSALTADEWPRAVGVASGCAALAVAFWAATSVWPPPFVTIKEQWQLGLMVWFILTPVVVATLIIGYSGARRRSPAEARLILNEELWRETRRDQRRIARWINYSRLQHGHRSKETLG